MQSISDPTFVHKSGAAYLAEIIMVNREPSLKDKPQFWRNEQYRKSYVGFLLQLQTRLKYAPYEIIEKIIVEKKLTSLAGDFDKLVAEEIAKS